MDFYKRSATEEDFKKIYDILAGNFPLNELRSEAILWRDFHDKHYQCELLSANDKIILVNCRWNLPSCEFWEYIAVEPEFQNLGIASSYIKEYFAMRKKNLPCILEVELPDNDLAKRRIAFYQRLDFVLHNFDYWQPEINKNQGPLRLNLMTYRKGLSQAEFNSCLKDMMHIAYRNKNFNPFKGEFSPDYFNQNFSV